MDKEMLDQIAQIQSVTIDEVNAFLRRADAEKPCDACGRKVEWWIRTIKDRPLLTTMPFWLDHSMSEVYFSLFCPMCGHTRLFNAHYVAVSAKDYREKNNG